MQESNTNELKSAQLSAVRWVICRGIVRLSATGPAGALTHLKEVQDLILPNAHQKGS